LLFVVGGWIASFFVLGVFSFFFFGGKPVFFFFFF